jgi:hypothetical protein
MKYNARKFCSIMGIILAMIFMAVLYMYIKTGKIPFFEPRKRSKSYFKKEKMEEVPTPPANLQGRSRLSRNRLSIEDAFGGNYSEHKLIGYRAGDHFLNACRPCFSSLESIAQGYKMRMDNLGYEVGNIPPNLLGQQLGFRMKQGCSECFTMLQQTWGGVNDNWNYGSLPSGDVLSAASF